MNNPVRCALLIVALVAWSSASALAADMNKVLRVRRARTSPASIRSRARICDSTRIAIAHFRGPLRVRLSGDAGESDSEHGGGDAADQCRRRAIWTIKLKRGIRFADDPVFKGKPRELVAEDYVYSIKRSLDPNLRNGGDPALTDLIEGARPVVDAARKAGAKFDYDAKIAGLRRARLAHVADPADATRLHGAGAARGAARRWPLRAKRSKRRATT